MPLYLFDENIIVISEDTTRNHRHLKDHMRKKKEVAVLINDNKNEFHKTISSFFSKELAEKKIDLTEYSVTRYIYKYLYVTKTKTNFDIEEIKRYSPLLICEYTTLRYFTLIKNAIKISVKYELFRYLGIEQSQIGVLESHSPLKNIEYPIICPADWTKQKDGVRVVSFMLSPQMLIKNGYVLRKDNWEPRSAVYQRLIQANRVKKIREYVAKNGTAFLNNVIVGLPDGIKIFKKELKDGRVSKTEVNIDDITIDGEYSIQVPDQFNTLCIIDGQHRIYAHHEAKDKQEAAIKRLRTKLHLLVTGVIYPETMTDIDRSAYASDVFIDINDNTKKVPAEVMLHVKTFKNPFSDVAIARLVIEKLNRIENGVFENRLQISALETAQIKTSSIVKFALKYLVTLTPSEGRLSLVNFIEPKLLESLKLRDSDALTSYVNFCANFLDKVFKALKFAKSDYWNDPTSMIQTVTSINGIIMAVNTSLKDYGVRDFDFYRQSFNKLSVSFSKEQFGFASSQYRKFSVKVIGEIFDIRKA